ncbi:MAG: hypothetical protein AAB649_01705 [Patescibacteria group bacterium]
MNVSQKVTLRYNHAASVAVRRVLDDWPAKSRRIAKSLIEKYGTPHEATPSMLLWNYNGYWKRTVIHREGVRHNVPRPHLDILEQTVDAKVRPNTFAEIMKFDGSISINRTRGEMTAYCESEHANIFLLNLAHDIAIGRQTALQAQKVLYDASDFFHAHLPNNYRDSLLFTATIQTNDQDMVTAQPN